MTSSGKLAADPSPPPYQEQLILSPAERREAVLDVIRSARERLVLSLFRCDDFRVLDALAEALQRNVRVEALLTRRAKGWKKRLKELWAFLESMGAAAHRYRGPVSKYHAKYIVADDGPAVVTSLNFTRKCFEQTCDFLVITHDPAVVEGLKTLFEIDCHRPERPLPGDFTDRLIVGPEMARSRLTALIASAHRSIHIVDPKLTDPAMVALLKSRAAAGVRVQARQRRIVGGLFSHGKLILIDGELAVAGSLSLSPVSLDARREVAILIRDPYCVAQLNSFFEQLSAVRAPRIDNGAGGPA